MSAVPGRKNQVFYIHGGNAYSKYDDFIADLCTRPIRDLPGVERPKVWVDSLREDLGDDFEVFMPSMPNKQNAKYLEWKIWFERHFEYVRDGVDLVGWSQGGWFLAKYLIENETPFAVRRLILLAAPFVTEDFGGEDGGDFAFNTARAGELEARAEKIFVIHSTDDPVVPYRHAEQYAAALPKAKLLTFTDKNHFLVAEFTELVALIKG